MLTVKKIISSVTLVVLAFGLTACASTNYNKPASAAEMATLVIAPVTTWNPVAGSKDNPGSAASAVLRENDGYFETSQTYEGWNHSGEPLPETIRTRHEQGSNPNPKIYYRN